MDNNGGIFDKSGVTYSGMEQEATMNKEQQKDEIILVESPCKVGDIIYNKNIKFYLNSKEIPFEELSKLPQMTTDRENHTITEILLNYIDKDAIFFYTKTEHYTVVDGADDEYYGET